jgi:hypothetical protein
MLVGEYHPLVQTGHVSQTHNMILDGSVAYHTPFLDVSAPPISRDHLYPIENKKKINLYRAKF